MNTIYELSQYALHELKDSYTKNEAGQICRLIFMDVFQYTNIDIHIKNHEKLNESFVNKFCNIITQLKTNKPLQYIIGETEFAGLRFQLNPDTLIPRPETEELVIRISRQVRPDAQILDIGTGSGCIAISLAHLLPRAHVSALDISSQAIQAAQQNAQQNHVAVQFITGDILSYKTLTWDQKYDVIVSNPPYVCNSEKKQMHRRVLEFEPHRALFVSDDDPLLFYREIANFGRQQLTPGGYLFFEINEALGQQTCALLHETGYTDIVLEQDIHDKDRFIRCTLPQTTR